MNTQQHAFISDDLKKYFHGHHNEIRAFQLNRLLKKAAGIISGNFIPDFNDKQQEKWYPMFHYDSNKKTFAFNDYISSHHNMNRTDDGLVFRSRSEARCFVTYFQEEIIEYMNLAITLNK